ncbi:hypothetical protein NFI96_034472 [Prochilodus magdalenae]|nr:hypothetical protein NFI96_034472 [Prochilodus magdalenae]
MPSNDHWPTINGSLAGELPPLSVPPLPSPASLPLFTFPRIHREREHFPLAVTSQEDTKERHLVSMTPVQASSSDLLLEILLEVAFPSIVQPLEDPVSSCAFRAKIIGELLATVVEDTVSMTVPPLVRTNEGDTKDIIDLLEALPEEPQPANVQPLDDLESSQDYDAMVIGELLGTLVDDAVSMSVLPLVRTNDREPEDISEILEVLPEEPQTSNVQPLDDPESSRDYDAMMIGELLGTLVDNTVSMSVLPLVRTNNREPEDISEILEVLPEEPQTSNVQPLDDPESSCDWKSNMIGELLATLVDDAVSMRVLPLVRTNDREPEDIIELSEVLQEEPQPANVQLLDDPESSCDWKSNIISELLATLVDDAISMSVLPLVRTNEGDTEDIIDLLEVLQEEPQPANVQPLDDPVSSQDYDAMVIGELLGTLVDDAVSMSVLPLVRTNERDHVDTIELLEVLPEEPQPANVQPLDDPESSCDWKSNMISELLGTLVDDAVSISVLPLGPICSVDVSAASFVSVESGQNVALLCKEVEGSDHSSKIWVWYKQRTGQEPHEVAMKLGSKAPGTSSTRFKIVQSFNLTIEQAIKDDEGMYFCAVGEGNTISFSKGTFLAVAGQPQLNISVLQTPVWGSVTPGESVTLQCTVLPDLKAAGLPVLWFRDAAGQSFPEVIYTHQKTGSHQCEFSSSTNSCMYNFSISNFSQSDAGTYYCAVAACGRIIVGNGVSVHFAVRNSEALVISAKPGQAVTLNCMFASQSSVDVKMWYKQRLEHAPLEVGTQLEGKSGMISNKFDRSRYKISRTASGVSLRIEGVTKEDEGMYFCGAAGTKTLDFSNSTFLAVTGQLDISVLQTPAQGPVSPGEPVTLQCTVLSDLRAADLRVLWFRAAAGQSFPEIIYTHQNSSSRQCEISSSKNCSVYNFSRNILNHHHTGTYYCAVAACGRIIFGNGTAVGLNGKCLCTLPGTPVVYKCFSFLCSVEEPDKAPVDPVAMTLAVFSAVCVAVICAQTIYIYKMRRSEHRAGEQIDISVLQTPVQGSVSPGEPVTLQCTVLSEIRVADLRVLWFRAAAGQSFPEIIYTHQNSSSRQCEISSSKNCSVYSFSRNILNHHHTGTYYCAVAACEKIIFGNGTAVGLNSRCLSTLPGTPVVHKCFSFLHSVEEPDKAPVDPVAMTLAVFSAVCVAVICAQTIYIYKMRRSEHRAGGPVHAEDLSKASFVSVESGKNVTLHCRFGEKSAKSNWVWYRQRTGQEPEEVAVKLFNKIPTTSSNRLKINDSFNLTIEQTNKDDEGMYFCGEGDGITITFSKGTFLAVTGQPQLNISVLQTPVQGPVSPGEPVTLQCTVLSEIRAADLRVLWFRAAAGQSFPEIIYTHQNSSSPSV